VPGTSGFLLEQLADPAASPIQTGLVVLSAGWVYFATERDRPPLRSSTCLACTRLAMATAGLVGRADPLAIAGLSFIAFPAVLMSLFAGSLAQAVVAA
jgi:hypothetical protein